MFPLQFEWAWQNPYVSKAVRKAAANFKTLGGFANKIKLAYTMLTLPPWQRYHLIIFLVICDRVLMDAHVFAVTKS